jgi:hypothetical protein
MAAHFNEPNVDKKDIARLGEQLILALHLKKGVKCDSLDDLRYRDFNHDGLPRPGGLPAD